MDRDALVEAMAEALWDGFAKQHLHPADYPSWGELLAQGHQGMHRVHEFRAYARAALAVAEPVVREDERLACLNVAQRWTRDGHSATAHGIILGIEERTGGTP